MTTIGWLFIITALTLIVATIKGQVFDSEGKFVLVDNLKTLVDASIRGDTKTVDTVTGAAGGGYGPDPVEGEVLDVPGTAITPNMKGTWVPGSHVSQKFGNRNARYIIGWHTGVDLSAPEGTPIFWNRPTAGRVSRFVGGKYGNGIIIDDGANEWLFGHCQSRAVAVGQAVQPGQKVASVGHSGFTLNGNSPHLHLEKSSGRRWAYGKVVNPL